jgi:butyrate kinase
MFAINLGSTSTKVAYCEDETIVVRDTISHAAEELDAYPTVFDQKEMRQKAVLDYMDARGIDLSSLDAFVTRGGQTEPLSGGVWEVNEDMVRQAMSGYYGVHVCSVGTAIALDVTRGTEVIPLTVDTPSTDEFETLARYSGLPEIRRLSCFQALNSRAMAREYARRCDKRYEDLSLIVVMLGGGITAVAHDHGRMVDATDGLEGDGCFSNNRCNGVPVGQLVRLCYSGRFTEAQMMRHINGEAGLMGYLGTTDTRALCTRIEQGDGHASEVLEAMCYQAAKDVGGMATVLKGKVDATLLVGGMANAKFITDQMIERIGFIADVVVMPGELEMEALTHGAYDALRGRVPIQQFRGH